MNEEAKSEQNADERGEKDVPPPVGMEAQADLLSVSNDAFSERDVNPEQGAKPFWKRKAVWIAVIAVEIVAVGGVAGGVAWNVRVKDEALSGCRQYVGRIRRLAGTPLGKETIEATKVDKKDVADARTWEMLRRNAKELKGLQVKSTPACDASSRVTAQEQQNGAGVSLKSLKTARASVEKSAKAVLDSRDAKALKDVRDALMTRAGQARQLLDSSAGNVADDATRAALSQQIDAVNGLLGNQQSKLADLQQTSQELDGAVNGVNASVQAKAEADARAAEQARQVAAEAQAAQARAAQQQMRNRTSQTQGQSTGGGSSVPAQNGLAPGRIHFGGYGSYEEWMAHQIPLGNGCNAAGVCGIG